jgi:hypothetical protein
MLNGWRLFGGAFLLGAVCAFPAQAAENIQGQQSGAAEGSHIFCDATGAAPVHKAPCQLRSLYITTGAVAGYLMVFNAVSAPADGAVTPRDCIYVPALMTASLDLGTTGEMYDTGVTASFSTTGCFSKTVSATAFFKARVQ